MLGVERLRALCAVSEQGSVTAAARMLHVTSSSVSQQLAKLEKEIGIPVLVQSGRGVQLTDAGRLLARHGSKILSLLAQAESEVISLDRDVRGQITIGAIVSAGRVVLPEAIAHLRDSHPALEVRFRSDDTDDLLPSVVRREVDLAVVDSWATMPLHLPDDVLATRIHQDFADVALPADHPRAGDAVIDLHSLADMPWTTWRKDESFHVWLVQTLRAQGVEPLIRYEVPEFSAQLEFVARGLAAALVPRLARAWVPSDVILVPVQPALLRDIYAVRRKDNDRPSVQAGIAALTKVFGELT